MFGEYRHKLEIYIFIILVFIAFCTPDYWIQWAFLASIAFLILVVGNLNSFLNSDLLFTGENDFIFDPDYNHWKSLQEPKDFQFEADFTAVKGDKKKF